MNKRELRTFSLGIIFAVCILGSYFYYFTKDNQKAADINSSKDLLQKNGYIVLTSNEYHKLAKKQIDRSTAPASIQKYKTNQTSNLPAPETSTGTYSLNVTPGMNLGEIAKLLAQQKIIDNETKFSQYLIDHNEESKIQLGTYTLTNQMNYEQIAKLITKSK